MADFLRSEETMKYGVLAIQQPWAGNHYQHTTHNPVKNAFSPSLSPRNRRKRAPSEIMHIRQQRNSKRLLEGNLPLSRSDDFALGISWIVIQITTPLAQHSISPQLRWP